MNIIRISKLMLEENKDYVIQLLCENLYINLPALDNLHHTAEEEYCDLLKYVDDGSAILLGAMYDGKLVGLLWAYKKRFLSENRAHLRDIIVDENYRRKGIGRMLESEFTEMMINEGVQVIELITSVDNTSAVDFYNNNGYKVTRVQLEKRVNDYEN